MRYKKKKLFMSTDNLYGTDILCIPSFFLLACLYVFDLNHSCQFLIAQSSQLVSKFVLFLIASLYMHLSVNSDSGFKQDICPRMPAYVRMSEVNCLVL